MSQTAFQTLNYSVDGQVALITLNRPQVLNACDQRLRQELLAALQLADADEEVRVKVLTGAGRAFCVGQDLSDGAVRSESVRSLLEQEYQPIMLALDQSAKLTIAAVNGAAAGVGSALALTCDLVIMADDAYMYQAFIALGLVPDGGATWQLVRQLGYRQALELAIDGGRIPAGQCLDLGLTNRVAPAASLLQHALQWAAQLADKAPLAVRYSKQALKFAQRHSLEEAIACEAQLQQILADSSDAVEGTRAFLEKRKPVFTGK